MISQIYRKIKRKIQIKIVSIICVISMLNMDYHCVAFNNKTETLYPSQRSKIKQTDQQNGNPANVLHKPIVFIIEDGHCIPEIQLNISNTLFELRRTQNVSDIYVEGCSGDQDFDYLRLYPVAEKREKILSGYLKKGIISGVEYFAANTAAENSITVTGLEDMDIYRKNKATLEKISNYSAVTSLLNELNISIEKLTGSILQYSSVGLRRVLSEINISNVEESVGVLMFHNRFFKKAGIVRDYPQLCGYYKNIFELSGINFDEVIAESKKIPDNLDSLRITDELAKRIRARFTKLYISPIESDDIDKQIIDIICANKSYSNLRKFLIHNLAINSIDKTIVNNQMNSFLQSYLTSVAQNQKEKSRIKVYFALQTINKLLNLEFSYYDAMDINSGNLFSQIYIEAGKVSAGFAAEIRSLIDRLDPIVMESLKFYDLALKRDLTMQRKFIESYQKSKSPSVIVMGGFHLKSFMKYLEDNAIPFNLLSAKIGNISSLNRKIYIQHFMTTLNPIPNMVYNKSSLGAEPVLSLTGKTGPSGIWFNEVIGKHADALKHDKVKASIWIKALNANLVKTKNKIANVILVTSLAAMLGLTEIVLIKSDT